MRFARFASFFMRNNFRASTAIGVNVYSQQRNELTHIIQSNGDRVIDGDFKNFDGSQLAVIHEAIIKEIINFVGVCRL